VIMSRHGGAVRADRACQHPHRGRAVRVPRRPAGHPGGRGLPCHRPRRLRQLSGSPQARTDH
jgi:hypothetical protein